LAQGRFELRLLAGRRAAATCGGFLLFV